MIWECYIFILYFSSYTIHIYKESESLSPTISTFLLDLFWLAVKSSILLNWQIASNALSLIFPLLANFYIVLLEILYWESFQLCCIFGMVILKLKKVTVFNYSKNKEKSKLVMWKNITQANLYHDDIITTALKTSKQKNHQIIH